MIAKNELKKCDIFLSSMYQEGIFLQLNIQLEIFQILRYLFKYIINLWNHEN